MLQTTLKKPSPGRLKRRGRHVRDAVLLVAGRGSRLRPLTDDTPKCLLEVDGQPLLVRLLRQLAGHGIERAWLVTGYLHERIVEALDGVEGLPELHFAFNDTWDSYNNGVSLQVAMEAMEPTPFLLCDGDILIGEDAWLGEMLTDPRPNVLSVMLQLQSRLGAEEMKVQMEPVDVPWYTRRVVGLSKGLVPRFSHGESMGVQTVGGEAFEPLLARLRELNEEERERYYYEDVFAELIVEGHEFYTMAIEAGTWTEIDTIDDLQAARTMFENWSATG